MFRQSLWALALIATAITSTVSADGKKNVILIIGDGMDDHQITIARNYITGPRGRLTLDNMAVRGSVQVLTVDEANPDTPIYVADSANSATAMATGTVTSRGRIGTSPKTDQDLKLITEIAHEAGFKTGVVTSSSVTDATPASFAAHIKYRFCENTEKMVYESRGIIVDCSQDQIVNGGLGSISEQLANSTLDVILGGGMSHFSVNAENSEQTIATLAQTAGFQLIQTAAELNKTLPAQRLLGLFAEKHLEVRLQGEAGRAAEKPNPSIMNMVHWSQGEVELPAPMKCEANPNYGNTPSLLAMTKRAVKHLNHDNNVGFFLMVESAHIDKQSHARKPCGSIGELQQLDETLAFALEFAEANPDTLILVTADHGQAAQIVPNTTLYSKIGLPVFTPGSLARITMPNGGEMGVNYATNNFFSEEHTGVAVPIHGNEAARGIVKTLNTQPEIFFMTKNYLGL